MAKELSARLKLKLLPKEGTGSWEDTHMPTAANVDNFVII